MQLLIRLAADGTLVLILLITVVIVGWWLRHDFWRKAPIVVMAGLSSLFVGKVMSLLYQPDVARPFIELGREAGAAYVDNPGFPSDHALLAAAAIAVVYVATHRRRRLVITILTVLTVVMCVSRVVALVHTPADVVFGIVAGLSGAIWYMKLTKRA